MTDYFVTPEVLLKQCGMLFLELILILFFFITEKRAKFDNGEDPLDPNQQQGGQPFQWGDGGFPFGDGFNFKFHFN